MKYYIDKIIHLSFEETIKKLTILLTGEGFGILHEIDVKDTLKNKLNIKFRKYKILGVCNPPFAYKAITIEDKVGLLLPCNIIIQEKDIGIEVAIIDPVNSLSRTKNADLIVIASKVQQKFKKIIEKL